MVLRYYDRFVARFPDVGALAAAAPDDVLAAWSGLGYYRRARMLHDGARDVVSRFGGSLPQTVAELSSIAGIGRYTAGAIASIAFGQRAPIVDGNVARVAARIFAFDDPVGSPQLMRRAWTAAAELVEQSASPRRLNQGLMELGALICTPAQPRCEACPVERLCSARLLGTSSAFPLPRASRTATAMRVPIYLVSDVEGRVLLRRHEGELMTGLYHLPHGVADLLGVEPLEVAGTSFRGSFRHTITHRRVEFEVYAAILRDRIGEGGGEWTWLAPASIASVPHPSYVAKALRLAR